MKILWLRFTHQMIFDRKEQKERRKLIFKTNVSSQNQNVGEEGATVAASHLPSLSWLSHQAGPAAFFHGNLQLSAGKLH
jgi:hypothetical protein